MIVRSDDGTLIFCECHRAEKPRGAMLVVHGLGEHSGRYGQLIQEANALGLDVHTFDLRGHGRSSGTRGEFTIEEVHQDMDVWIRHLVEAGELRKELPCYLFGHSLGGLIALTYVAHYAPGPLFPQLDGMILLSPLVGVRWSLAQRAEGLVARRIPKFLHGVQIPNGIPFSSLTTDAKEVAKLEADPLMHQWITPGSFLSMERAMASLPRLVSQLDMPLLFLVSGKDLVVNSAATEAFAKKCAVAHPGQVEVRVFHKFFHQPFHETKRERAFLEFKKWILRWLPTEKRLNPTLSTKSSSKSSGKEATGKAISRSPRAKKARST